MNDLECNLKIAGTIYIKKNLIRNIHFAFSIHTQDTTIEFHWDFGFIELVLAPVESLSVTTIRVRFAASNWFWSLRRFVVKKITHPNPIKFPTRTRNYLLMLKKKLKRYIIIISREVQSEIVKLVKLTIGGTNLMLINTSNDK